MISSTGYPHPHGDHDSHDHDSHDDGSDYGECCPEGSTFMLLSRTDEISKTTPVTSIGPSDYQNAYDLEKFFTTQLQSSGSFKEKKITFEVDNGWFDVDGSDPSATYQHMSSSVSPYASEVPCGGQWTNNRGDRQFQRCSRPMPTQKAPFDFWMWVAISG